MVAPTQGGTHLVPPYCHQVPLPSARGIEQVAPRVAPPHGGTHPWWHPPTQHHLTVRCHHFLVPSAVGTSVSGTQGGTHPVPPHCQMPPGPSAVCNRDSMSGTHGDTHSWWHPPGATFMPDPSAIYNRNSTSGTQGGTPSHHPGCPPPPGATSPPDATRSSSSERCWR